jgi:hypothetical protein
LERAGGEASNSSPKEPKSNSLSFGEGRGEASIKSLVLSIKLEDKSQNPKYLNIACYQGKGSEIIIKKILATNY